MGENNWMTSEGLDLNLEIFNAPKSTSMMVAWGDLIGEFISYSSKNKRVQFRVKMVPSLFTLLETAPKEAKIITTEEDYTIVWNAYNYSVTNVADNATISIEENS